MTSDKIIDRLLEEDARRGRSGVSGVAIRSCVKKPLAISNRSQSAITPQ